MRTIVMDANIEKRLAELAIELPDASAPAANYVPFVVSGALVFVSGQLPVWNGELRHIGQVSGELGLEDGIQAARLCGLNLIAQVRAAAAGNLERISRVVKLSGFVNAVPGFTDHPKVVNGASNLIAEVFGDRGRHARFAVGSSSLPFGVAVEVDGVFELKPS